MKESLFCRKEEEIMSMLGLEKKFQARIVKEFLVKGVTDFDAMTSLPKKVRDRLTGSALSSEVIGKEESLSTIKLLIKLNDGELIECVRLTDGAGRHTACLSSQVGCLMGCAFCKTGTMGLHRNMTSGEIVEEFVHLEKLGGKISNIVFMGMGEPLYNFNPVMEAIREIHDPKLFNLSHRKITISTCGLVPGINKLNELNIPVRLAVSLVSANDEIRSSIMKVNRAYPLAELKKALISYQHQKDKRITLEYCLLGGVNTSEESARELARFTRGLDCLINLIPWNPIDELKFTSPSDREIDSFCADLKRFNVAYTIRRSKGRDISSACGQLATKNPEKEN